MYRGRFLSFTYAYVILVCFLIVMIMLFTNNLTKEQAESFQLIMLTMGIPFTAVFGIIGANKIAEKKYKNNG